MQKKEKENPYHKASQRKSDAEALASSQNEADELSNGMKSFFGSAISAVKDFDYEGAGAVIKSGVDTVVEETKK